MACVRCLPSGVVGACGLVREIAEMGNFRWALWSRGRDQRHPALTGTGQEVRPGVARRDTGRWEGSKVARRDTPLKADRRGVAPRDTPPVWFRNNSSVAA